MGVGVCCVNVAPAEAKGSRNQVSFISSKTHTNPNCFSATFQGATFIFHVDISFMQFTKHMIPPHFNHCYSHN